MRLLLVEDNHSLADVLQPTLGRGGFVVDWVADLADARAALALAAYDAVILDLSLPDGDGLELLRDIRAENRPTPVLILSARDRIEDRIRGLNFGADDYLPKPFDVGELQARLHALLRRPPVVVASTRGIGNLVVDEVTQEAEVDGKRLDLTRRERTLLCLLARRAGKAVARAAIDSALFGFDAEVGPNALEVCVHRLRRRLKEAGATVSIQTERNIGYVLSADEAP